MAVDLPVLRPAGSEDAVGVAEVYLASRQTFLPWAPLAHTDVEVRAWIRDILIPAGDVTVAETGGRIVGLLVVSRTDGTGWIDHLYLAPGFTGRGLGSRLLARAFNLLGPPIRLYTFRDNAGARRFYERYGFRAIAHGDGSENEEGCPDVLYEWGGPAGSAGGGRPR